MDVDDAARRRLAIRALQATGRIPRTPDFAGGETEASPSGTQGPPALQACVARRLAEEAAALQRREERLQRKAAALATAQDRVRAWSARITAGSDADAGLAAGELRGVGLVARLVAGEGGLALVVSGAIARSAPADAERREVHVTSMFAIGPGVVSARSACVDAGAARLDGAAPRPFELRLALDPRRIPHRAPVHADLYACGYTCPSGSPSAPSGFCQMHGPITEQRPTLEGTVAFALPFGRARASSDPSDVARAPVASHVRTLALSPPSDAGTAAEAAARVAGCLPAVRITPLGAGSSAVRVIAPSPEAADLAERLLRQAIPAGPAGLGPDDLSRGALDAMAHACACLDAEARLRLKGVGGGAQREAQRRTDEAMARIRRDFAIPR